MKRQTLLILFIATILPMSCSKKATTNAIDLELLNGEWQIVCIEEDTLPIVADEEMSSLLFDIQDQSFSCYVGCNRMGGSLSINKDSIRLGNIFSTRMYCPDKMQLEQKLGIALDKASRVNVSDENMIILQDKNGTSLVTLKRASK